MRNDTDNVTRETQKSKSEFFGVYRGYIEYINDPLEMGRVKVRIPQIYGLPEHVPTEGLPWAYFSSPFGGGHDYGIKAIPPVGSTVLVMFEAGWKEYPIVIGTWDGIPSDPVPMGRNPKRDLPKGKISMSPDVSTPWISPPGPDVPKEFLLQNNLAPERYVPFKSPKGATIDINDQDQKEHTHIVDRAGQGLFLEAPIKEKREDSDKFPANKGNEAQRGLNTAQDGDTIPLESTISNEASVELVDLNSQHISLETITDGNKIIIVSKQPETINDLTVGGNKEVYGQTNAIAEISSGNKIVNFKIINNGNSIANIALNGNTGVIVIESPLLIKIKAENILLDGDTSILGNLTVSKTIHCFENGLFSGEVLSTSDKGKAEIKDITQQNV